VDKDEGEERIVKTQKVIDDEAVAGPFFAPLMELPLLPETDEFEIITTSKEAGETQQQ
jgi:hypothetical protein